MSKSFDPRSRIGETHGIFTIVDMLDTKDKYGHYIYKGVCTQCGYVRFSHYGNFSGKRSATTVCKHIGTNGEYIQLTHWDNKRLHKIFGGMKDRCYNPNDKSYKWYGEKGIKICDEWMKNPKLFESWALNNGYTDSLTIDRIDENKNYCPENCRWISGVDNARYKSTSSLIEVNGEVRTGREWSQTLGIGKNVINTYVKQYGLTNTIEFIRRYIENPTLKPKRGQSYYNLYMMTTQN